MNKKARIVVSLWKRLSRGQKVILILVSLGNTLAAATIVLPSVVIGRIVTSLSDDSSAAVANYVLMLGGLLLGFVVLRTVIHVSLHSVLPRVEAALREAQLEHVLKTPVLANAQTQYTAELNSLMGRGAKAGADTVRIVFADLMPAAMQAVAAAVAAFAAEWMISVILLASGLVSTVITHFQLRSQGGVRVAINQAKARLDGIMTELLRGKAVIRTLDAADAESARVGQRALELSAVEVRHHKVMGFFDAAKTSAEGLFSVVVLVVAAGLVAGGASPGTVLTLYLLFMQFAAPLREIHRIRDELNESGLQLREALSILGQTLDPLFTRPAVAPHIEGADVVIDTVRFTYPDGNRALRGVSLNLPASGYLGICGPAGCGKTTLIQTLVGILPAAGGHISVGGVDVADMNSAQLAATVAYVSQTPYLVSGTIRANLLLGQSEPVSDARLEAALKQVGLLAEISGLDAAIGEDGRGLSGGQRQRLVLARVLLRPAKVIVLDEATSALDTLNEEQFMRALLASGRTVVAIAHRLSTLRRADEIIVMDHGRIVESGTHEALEACDGLFHRLLHADEHEFRTVA
ncbi:MAG: ABC transporter ATP-binding protein/permease [Bifidobacteriaceae bacterium]|jgi:ABC-type multidrug transport system fused ATPase/permease subunit|nr:ABC transporter ATP-binding protein/permease [Bifidobacteriaceae bacterium]